MIRWLANAKEGNKQGAIARLLLSVPAMIPAGAMALIWLGAASPVAPLIALFPICLAWIWFTDLFHVARGLRAAVTYRRRPWYFVFVTGCVIPILLWAAYLQRVTE